MEGDFTTAFTLLIVGMVTVLSILFLVIVFGKILILFVNKYYPEEEISKVKTPSGLQKRQEIAPAKLAAIVAAVDFSTGGLAKVTHVEKVEKT